MTVWIVWRDDAYFDKELYNIFTDPHKAQAHADVMNSSHKTNTYIVEEWDVVT